MGILNGETDAAMLDGLKEAIKDDLKQRLMETAEKEIELIIESMGIKLMKNNFWYQYKSEIKGLFSGMLIGAGVIIVEITILLVAMRVY